MGFVGTAEPNAQPDDKARAFQADGVPICFSREPAEVAISGDLRHHKKLMPNPGPAGSQKGAQLISLAQKLARDAERHALLSASLASQADRLMHAGLRLLDSRTGGKPDRGAAS
jgi:hypothetical protein